MASALRRLARPIATGLTRRWPARSRLFLVGEGTGWSIDHDLQELARIASRIGARLADPRLLSASRDQVAFYGSHFTLLREPWPSSSHALATAYFHGRPGTPGMPEFDGAYRMLCERHHELARVQVTHAEMRDVVLSSGIDSGKVVTIRIGVDLDRFAPQTPAGRAEARAALGLPEHAFVVGSFQKDGVGWGDGREPKPIKGPDVLVATLRLLRERVPDVHVLLSGPARGYVRQGLEEAGIPYVHRFLDHYEQIGRLYAALDAYVVPARQEGGPKSVLEAMASGVPVVSTRVGQTAELIRDGENGWLVDVEDAEGLAERLARAADAQDVTAAGLATARANAYDTQLPLWRSFFAGLLGGV